MPPVHYRPGTTFIELLVVLTLLGVLLAIAVTTGSAQIHRAAVHSAAREATDAFAAARDHALAHGTRSAVRINSANARLVVHSGSDTLARHLLGDVHRVQIESSRDSMAYAPSGLGWGAANLRLVIRRGAAAETVTVSRLGRVRRG